ncbi:MAG: hypothetical protein IPK67_11250 [Planctomycetes bacterium]|nr:hypothetical protein [Planctomycetota bacterium]
MEVTEEKHQNGSKPTRAAREPRTALRPKSSRAARNVAQPSLRASRQPCWSAETTPRWFWARLCRLSWNSTETTVA